MFKKHIDKQLSAFCNGELAADEAKRVEQHLLGCDRCRKEHDEISLGVNLAKQLPLATAPAEMWNEIEAILDQRLRQPMPEASRARLSLGFNWYGVAAVAAMLIVAVMIGVVVLRIIGVVGVGPTPPDLPALDVASVGAVRIDGKNITNKGSLKIGATLETGNSAQATVTVSEIGQVELAANSRIRLLQTNPSEHRLALDRGLMKATINAPPRLFFVNTPAAEAIDLGCVYTLRVDDAGNSLLHVTLGWVALVREGREVYVPRYAKCEARPGVDGPGTPYFEDASEAFVRALETFDFENGGDNALQEVLRESRQRDTFTLWHLLTRVEGDRRVQVLDRMIELVGLPKGITRAGTLKLDQNTLDAWRIAMDTIWF